MLIEEKGTNLGKAWIEPAAPVVAGTRQTFVLHYKAGSKGLKRGGAIRITIPHGFTTPQVDEFYKDGFVTASCPDSTISLTLEVVSRIFCAYKPELGHSGAFGKSLFVHLQEGELGAGKIIEIIYGDISYYGKEPWGPKPPVVPQLSGSFEFTVAIDPDGRRSAPETGYYLLPESPAVTILPAEAAAIIPVVPSNSEAGQDMPLHLITVDPYLNPVPTTDGDYIITSGNKSCNCLSKNGAITLPPDALSTGSAAIRSMANKELFAVINPHKTGSYLADYKLYWGDIHSHSSYSDGIGTPEEALTFARDAACLDFAALTDHDDIGPQLSKEEWLHTRRVTADFNTPGHFVTLLGYEYRSTLADMNIYYPGDEGRLLCGKEKKWDSPEKIISYLSANSAMIIPHMHFGADWRGYDPDLYRVMEIYSQHGSAEYIGCARQIPYLDNQLQKSSEGNIDTTLQEILARGMKLGVTAGSDSHSGRPGLSNWTRVARTYNGGLTAVFAREKTRESIWQAIYQRHCYATTGPRIYLEFSINEHPTGSELQGMNRKIRVNCMGTEDISRIEVVKNNNLLQAIPGTGSCLDFSLDDGPEKVEDFYYIRVTQIDGEMAWSSPIWVTFFDHLHHL